MAASGAGGGADLQWMRAAHLTASGTVPGAGEQTGDVGSHGREVLDDLFAGFDPINGSSAVRAMDQTDFDVVVDLRRWGSRGGRMAQAGLMHSSTLERRGRHGPDSAS